MYCIYGEWKTTKTTTRELICSTDIGICSLKAVVSANGYKTTLYSGFDPWPPGGEVDSGWPNGHRFVVSMKKAIDGWGGVPAKNTNTHRRDFVEIENWLQSIGAADMAQDLKDEFASTYSAVHEDFKKVIGTAIPEATNPKALSKAAERKVFLDDMKDLAFKRNESDPSWGIF